MRHGIDCEKVRHIVGRCYTHSPDDDSPYDVDGVNYCGRCHAWIEIPVAPAADLDSLIAFGDDFDDDEEERGPECCQMCGKPIPVEGFCCEEECLEAAAGLPDATESEIREDERKACWEDFIHVLRQGIKDAPHSIALKAMHEAVYLQGWKELGTGDGKPMHKRADSAVNQWNVDR